MIKIVRILEICWLVIAIVGVVLGTYQLTQGNREHSVYFYIFTLVAGIFYYMRRRQRIRLEEQEPGANKPQSTDGQL